MSKFLNKIQRLAPLVLLFCLLLFFPPSNSFAQSAVYDVNIAYCVYEGASYHVYHPDDWDYYECSDRFIVKWKVYDENCQLVSVTYGADSPQCLCDGTIQLEIMNKGCLTWCEEYTLPACRGGSENSATGEETVTDSGAIEGSTTSNMACGNACGDYSGEPCNEYDVVLGNINYCILEGINGTILNVATGLAFDCVEDAILEWRHWIPNPQYPDFSNAQFIVNASGYTSDVGSCLCGGTLQIKVRTACCKLKVVYFDTPACRYAEEELPGRDGRLERDGSNGGYAVYPNPTSDHLTIQLDQSETALVQIQVYAQDGRLVKSLSDVEEYSTTIAVDDLMPGVYWVQVIGTTSFTEKVIIQ